MVIEFIKIGLILSIGFIVTLSAELFSIRKQGITLGVASGILVVVAHIVFVYFKTPTLRLSTYFYSNLLGVVIAVLICWAVNLNSPSYNKSEDRKIKTISRIGIISLIVMGLVFGVSTIKNYSNAIVEYNTIKVNPIKASEELKSTKETPIAISTISAKNKVAKMMSVVPNSNAYELGSITAQVVNGEYVYVVAIDFKGFWEWRKFKEIPGYFIMSATDINAQPKFIEKPIQYTGSAYLGKDAQRNMYLKTKNYTLTGNVNLEIDDDGNPYYVQTLIDYEGFSNFVDYSKFKVAVINAVTGEVNVYKTDEAPKFINAPITASTAITLNYYFGKYKHGYWNTLFGKKDIKVPTLNGFYNGVVTPVLDKYNNLYYFVDLTSENSEQDSALGYTLVNARTGELQFYEDKSGMMDSDGAISVSSGLYPEKQWNAKMPILYNIDGTPTWIVSLLDENGIFKKYVYISALDSDIIVDGNSAQSTLENYRVRLSQKGSNNKDTEAAKTEKFTGEINRVQFIPASGDSLLAIFTIKGNDTVFTLSSTNVIQSVFLKEGDKVNFTADLFEGATSATIDNIEIEGVTPKSK